MYVNCRAFRFGLPSMLAFLIALVVVIVLGLPMGKQSTTTTSTMMGKDAGMT
jgi:hypothetical protein